MPPKQHKHVMVTGAQRAILEQVHRDGYILAGQDDEQYSHCHRLEARGLLVRGDHVGEFILFRAPKA